MNWLNRLNQERREHEKSCEIPYFNEEWKGKYNEKLRELRIECGEQWCQERKIEYFKGSEFDKLRKILRNHYMKIRMSKNPPKPGSITDMMIQSANEYPIEDLLDINRSGFAVCPFHDDNKPSFYTKNNFGHCFVCGKTASVIDIFMQSRGVGFKDAVKSLCR